MTPVSIRPSDFVEGGAVPVDKNLLWKECRFNKFDYTTKEGKIVATTLALRVTYIDDDGGEYVQQYSAGDLERFQPNPADGGKTLIAVGTAQALSKSSNMYILLNALINAGFPENRIPEDGNVSVLDGLYTFNIGLPEPKRSGLVRAVAEGETVRERVLSVPSQILRLPWEKKGAKAGKAPAKGKPPVTEEESDDDITDLAIAFVGKHLVDGATTRQKVAVAVFKDLAKDPNKDAIATLIFKPEFQGALLANGYTVDGEKISKA